MDTSPEVYRLFDRVTASVPGPVSLSAVYADLRWPAAGSADRPYVAMNMVTTLDGKVVVGGTGTTKLIGSAIDHALMERINLQADAILGGASTVRADGLRYPKITAATQRERQERGLRPRPLWVVVSRRGEMPLEAPFFRTDRTNLAAIVSGAASRSQVTVLDERVQVIRLRGSRQRCAGRARSARHTPTRLGRAAAGLPGRPAHQCLAHRGGPGRRAIPHHRAQNPGRRRRVRPLSRVMASPPTPRQLELLSAYRAGSELFLRYRFPTQG